jgi:hypothetical protein
MRRLQVGNLKEHLKKHLKNKHADALWASEAQKRMLKKPFNLQNI